MSLHKKINEDTKTAMLARDEVKITTLKSVKAIIANELLTKSKGTEELKDDEVVAIIKRLVKQHKDSIEQFAKGGRKDLVKVEEAELKILGAYLPVAMSEADIEKIAKKKKTEMKIDDKTKIGQLIGAVLKETKGLADGGVVKEIVEKLF